MHATRRLARAAGVVTALVGCAASIAACGLPGGGRHAGTSSGSVSASGTPAGGAGALPKARFTIPHEQLTKTQTVEVAVTALYRSGPFVRLGVRVTCVEVSGDACDEPAKNFRGGPITMTGNYGGFRLIDAVDKKLHDNVYDGDHPLASEADDINRGDSEDGWAVFPAPPGNVRTLDVAVPDGGPVLLDVPIGPERPDTQTASPNPDYTGDVHPTSTHGLSLPIYDMVLHSSSAGEEQKQHKDRTDVTLSSDVLFEFGKADLTSRATAVLDRVAARMDQDATGTIEVTGYTDSKGTPKVNDPLSKNRANAVAGYLRTHVTRGLTYDVRGKGEADPVAPNTKSDSSDNPKGRAKNRRVTVSYKTGRTSSSSPTPSRTPTQRPTKPGPVRWNSSTVYGGMSSYELTVRDVRPHNGLTLVRLSVKCLKGKENGCELTKNMGDGFSTVRKFTLYDAATRTTYQAAEIDDDVGDTVSTSLPEITDVTQTVDVGAQRDYWVYFPPLDPGTTAVDLKMPYDEATVRNVPVT